MTEGIRRVQPAPRHSVGSLQQLTVQRSILIRAQRLYALVALTFVVPCAPAAAQRARGPGDDATVLRAGQVRFGIRTEWSFANERFGRDGTARAGQPEPLGSDYTQSMGPSVFEHLVPLEAQLQGLLGAPVDALTAGTLRTTMDLGVYTTPVTIDVGITNHLTLSAYIPYLKTLNDVSVYANTPVGTANVGLNPGALLEDVKSNNGLVVSQLTAAASKLNSELTRCASSTDQSCAAINADRTGATALVTQAGSVATAIGRIYGTSTVQGNAFAPLGTSALQGAVQQKLSGLATSFGTFLGSPPGLNTWIDARPTAASLMAWNDFQAVLVDSALGIAGVPLESVRRSHLGDISVGGKLLLFDTTNPTRAVTPANEHRGVRLSLSGMYRLPTAQLEAPDNFADVGTGNGAPDIEGAAYLDAVLTRRIWASVVARYAMQKADQLSLRIAPQGTPFPALYRQQEVQRDLGDIMSVDVYPRYSPNDVLVFAGWYRWARKGADAYSGTFSVTDLGGATQSLDAAVLNANTIQQEQRVGAGITYSTLSAWQRGQARWPIEVTVMRAQTLTGSNAVVKATTTTFGLRYYARLFGAPLRPPRPKTPSPFSIPRQ